MDVNAYIKNKFRVKGMTTLPLTGWLNSTREHLAELFCELGYKVGAEIGVRWGGYSESLLQKNPGLKLYCIDSWAPYPGGRPSQERQDRIFRRAERVLSQYKGVHFIKKESMEALADIPDNSLDFVYIDAMHDYCSVTLDLIGWYKKVRPGGIISGHDYIHLHGCGVIPAVNGFVQGMNITNWYLTQDYTPAPSWFFVK